MLSLFRNARLSLRRLWMEVTAVGTLEFALIVPFMALVMLGGYETANYVRMSQRVEIAANSIAEMISQIPPSSAASQTGDGLLTLDQIHFFGDSIMYMVPDALSEADRLGNNWWDNVVFRAWSVEFKPSSSNCGSNCTYTPVLLWYHTNGNGSLLCGKPIRQAPDTSIPSPLDIPASAYGPDSVVFVQLSYTYVPSFGASFIGSSTITRTAIMSPRIVPIVESSDYAEGAGNCPNTP